ncbi:MAG: proline dehydrogenase family protein, partial [Anaerolineales bacterium]|nr:proline dehydrogenase family protein [Anaerolineales bacterium]
MVKPKRTPLILMAGLLLLALLLYLYGERWLRRVLLYLSHASWAREIVTNFPPAWLVASRFVAGETIEDALNTTRTLNSRGMSTTMDFLGESVTDPTEAAAARDHILEMLDRIHQTGLNANVSVKLSQLGLKLDPALAQDNLRLLLERARQYNNKVRIDMEESALVDVTLKIYHTLRFQERFD